MRRLILLISFFLAVIPGYGGGRNSHLRFVNPFTGTAGHGHTFPGATLPFGMVQLSPDTRVEGWDACAGYHYTDSVILGFSHTHLSGTGVADYGDILITPSVGAPRPGALKFSHADESASPGYYRVRFSDQRLTAELTATPRVGIHRYSYPATDSAYLTIDLHHGLGPDRVIDSWLHVVNDHEIAGMRRSNGWAKDQIIYFTAVFSRPFSSVVLLRDSVPARFTDTLSGTNLRALLRFRMKRPGPVLVKVALSSTGVNGAEKNLAAEAVGGNFERYAARAATAWESELSRIEVSGERSGRRSTFYTALYHALLAPNIFSDVDGSYRGMDGAIHTAHGFTMYTVYSLWDTFRAEHPLLTILDSARTLDMVRSLLAKYEESGFLPVWELASNETWTMIGYHAVPVIVDAYMKGIRGFDAQLALRAMVHSAMADQFSLTDYRTNGYIPGDREGESVSKTLEYAYDDWCIALFADSLGRRDLSGQFYARASSYLNVFDPGTRFMRARVNGAWVEPFDPTSVTVHYTEANPWQASMFVPHDIAGLAGLLGGPSALASRLDSLFLSSPELTGRKQDDISGLVGQYAQGNEPSHHMAFLYDMTGQPWKTSVVVRRICDSLYSAQPDGLCGNDDCGQMSAWYVMSSIGLYETCPGDPRYWCSAPLFDTVRLHTDAGSTFTLISRGRSASASSITAAQMNGRPYSRAFVEHGFIRRGGSLEYTLGDGSASSWGRGPEDALPTTLSRRIIPAPYFSTGAATFTDSLTVGILSSVPAMTIRYTLDGSTPGESSAVFVHPLTLRETAVLKAISIAADGRRSGVTTGDFRKHRNIGTLLLNSRYSQQYTGGGENALIDGIMGGPNFRLGAWQGYEMNDLDAVLDLGTLDSIDAVSLGCLQDVDSWIFYPEYVEFTFSVDGRTFGDPVRIVNHTPATDVQPSVFRFSSETGGKGARFIRVFAKNVGICPSWHRGAGGKAWLFADELTVGFRK